VSPETDRLLARSVESGVPVWSVDLEPGTTGLTVKNGRVYVAHRTDVLVLSAQDGSMIAQVVSGLVFPDRR
jgi:hypothetical protein